jgi:superfamily II DNA/RNA helicase
MAFKKFDLHPGILKALEEKGYNAPTPIQDKAIPKIIDRSDLIASAQTGTGKTAAFLLPALMRLTSFQKFSGPRILILVPTRELAIQVAREATKYSKYLPKVKTVCVYGGTPYFRQMKDLSKPYEILVATPGRLIDFLDRGKISLSSVEMFVLDEADRMLDMGFIDDVERIAKQMSETVQTVLFSATIDKKILKLSKHLLEDPFEINLTEIKTNREKILQQLYHVDDLGHKQRLLGHLLLDSAVQQVIIFTSTKRYADELAIQLTDQGHLAAALHGDINQSKRTRTIMRLKEKKIRILVATDVAARGIDIDTITHVINFDLPLSAEDYVHRIGRTGRALANGTALSFVAPRESHLLKRIEQFTGQKIQTTCIPGMEPKGKKKPLQDFKRMRRKFHKRKPAVKNKY